MREEDTLEFSITGLIVPIWKRKADVHNLAKHRGTTLLSHNIMLKLPERILGGRIRAVVEGEIGEEQQEFRQGRGPTGGMFAHEATSGYETGMVRTWQFDS